MKEHDRKVIYYYYCLFRQNKNLYYETYERTIFDRVQTYHRLSPKGHDFVNSSYHQATHYYGLDTEEYSKERFLDLVAQDGFYNPKRYKRFHTPWTYKRYWRKSSFRLQPHHTKKEVSEEQILKKEWRDYKGFNKDQSKVKAYRRNAGKQYKRLSNKEHRSWEKEMMAHNRYDEMGDKDYHLFLDPWKWD